MMIHTASTNVARSSRRVFMMMALVFLIFMTAPAPVEASSHGFLSPPAIMVNVGNVTQELNEALTEALGHGYGAQTTADDGKKMEARRARIVSMFGSMPKNAFGKVDRQAVRYLVHRYFGATHGWSIAGFESKRNSEGENATANSFSPEILLDKLPSYVENVMEGRLERDGFTAHDVVVMVMVLERLILDDSIGMLESAYRLNHIATDDGLGEERLQEVMESFMMIFALASQRTNRTRHELVRRYLHKTRGADGWPSGVFARSETKAMVEELKRQNPFREPMYSFQRGVEAAFRQTERYGQWTNENECSALKDGLVALDREGDGRVPLLDFYAQVAVGKSWYFDESLAYLRAQGLLDESSRAKGPQVMIANYVQSPGNCITVSGFYSVCCKKECEPIMGEIEAAVKEPTATPGRLIRLAQGMLDERSSLSESEESRNLTAQLVAQLEAVAEQHGGQIPLHGRLFQQWLHYVFPRECPYPNTEEVLDGRRSKEWEEQTGQSRRLSRSEVQRYTRIKKNQINAEGQMASFTEEDGAADQTMEEKTVDMSHWTFEEEIYIGHTATRVESTAASGYQTLRSLMWAGVLIGGLTSLALMLQSTFKRGIIKQPKDKGCHSI